MFDVLVIGSGLAGSIAALVARASGARVGLASRSWGATAMSTGALDIAYAPALSRAHQESRNIAEHVMDIAAHRRRHPYAVLGVERSVVGIRRGFTELRRVLEPAELAPPELALEADNLHLPSALGVAFPAASALAPHLGVDFSTTSSGRWLVAQLAGHSRFDAGRVVAGLETDAAALAGGARDLASATVDWDGRGPDMALARRLDDAAEVEELGRAVARVVRGVDGVIMPPLLGLERSASVRARLSEMVGAPVVEALGYMPSVPGVRLQQALDRAVRRAGVTVVGELASVGHHEGGHLASMVTRDDLEISAGSFVLATGRFISGGVSWEEHCREPLFDLPVLTEEGLMEDDSPHPVVRDTPMESHPLMTAGVQVGADLRPLREGQVAFTNLFAAGMAIGGFASRYALCADGVALASGFWAGRAAAGLEEAS